MYICIYVVTRSVPPLRRPLHGVWSRMRPNCGVGCGVLLPPVEWLWGFWV